VVGGVLYQIAILRGMRGRILIRRPHLRPHAEVFFRLSSVSATGMLQFLIAHASWIGLVRIIATSGAEALAGYTIAIRIVMFSLLPSWGLSNSAATLVGQNLGARRAERAEGAVWRIGLYNAVFLGAVSVVFILMPEPLVRIFNAQAEVVRYGADCLRIFSYGYLFYAYGMVLVQAFNGAGDTVTPTWINLGVYWCFQIPLAWLLAWRRSFGAYGAFWAVPVAESLLTVVGLVFFRRGAWKRRVI
jgi:Na+-driven multidrug efflux pump